jgi:ubiquinone/menaquinone biosynthesis C-methylase UbiE
MADAEPVKGWFEVEGRPGDRTLEMQMLGLDPLLDECKGATILDIGCAEGLIAMELAKAGAKVHGIDIVESHIETAKRICGNLSCSFEVADAATYEPEAHDIVLMLAILQKLKDPSHACAKFARAAKDLIVMRLPPANAPIILDRRSNKVPHDMKTVMEWYGFQQERVTRGSFSEWTGFFRRKKRV